MESRVASWLASFGTSGAGAAGFPPALLVLLRLLVLNASCPAPFTFRLCLGLEFSSLPEFPLPWLRLMGYRVSSDPAPSGFAVPASSGFPESCIYGWVDDDFSVFLELCILGEAADESSNLIGPCTLPSDSGCILNLIRAFRLPASRQALKLHFFHSPAVSFLTSPALGSFSRYLPSLVVFPMRLLFLSAFQPLSLGGCQY